MTKRLRWWLQTGSALLCVPLVLVALAVWGIGAAALVLAATLTGGFSFALFLDLQDIGDR